MDFGDVESVAFVGLEALVFGRGGEDGTGGVLVVVAVIGPVLEVTGPFPSCFCMATRAPACGSLAQAFIPAATYTFLLFLFSHVPSRCKPISKYMT